jgi:hypothetical protein
MSDESKERSLWTTRIDVASVAHKFLRFSFGMPGLAFSGGLLSFVAGLGLTDAALDAFWPQWNSVDGIRLAGGVGAGGIRLAGGVAAFAIFLSAIKWRNRLSWPQVLVAISLFPVIFLVWFCISLALWFGSICIFDRRPDPAVDLRLAVLLMIAFGGAVWILGRRFGPGRKHRA